MSNLIAFKSDLLSTSPPNSRRALILSISEFMCTFPEIWPRTLSPRLRFDRELDFLLPLSGFSIASKSGPDFRSFLPSQSMEIEVRLPTSDTGGRWSIVKRSHGTSLHFMGHRANFPHMRISWHSRCHAPCFTFFMRQGQDFQGNPQYACRMSGFSKDFRRHNWTRFWAKKKQKIFKNVICIADSLLFSLSLSWYPRGPLCGALTFQESPWACQNSFFFLLQSDESFFSNFPRASKYIAH